MSHSAFLKPERPGHQRGAVHLRIRELALFRDPSMVRLATSYNQTEGEVVGCSDGPIVIGRSPSADLHVKDQWVSRRQCTIQRIGDDFSIRDLESRHGTYVNGEQVDYAELRAGDTIRIGLTLLEVRCVG